MKTGGWLALALVGCSDPIHLRPPGGGENDARELLGLPDHFQSMWIPEYDPITAEKIELGRHLFYDRRLSGNETQACADCHVQALAFSDGKKTPSGSTGEVLVRNSPGLTNVGYLATLTWAHSGFFDLEDQLEVPIVNDVPVELGVNDGVRDEVFARFDEDPQYAELLAAAFPDSSSGITLGKITFSLASFVRSLISKDSPFDRFTAGDRSALTEQQALGMSLFNGEKFECFHCHGGVQATLSYRDANDDEDDIFTPFFNTGLYNVGGDGSYPSYDQGLYNLTFDPELRGFFRPPSLRNVALTAPYMHDGSIATLREVVETYAAGGRNVTEGPWAGDGRLNPLKSGLVRPFDATDEEIDAVVAFLQSMTDPLFVANPAYADPRR